MQNKYSFFIIIMYKLMGTYIIVLVLQLSYVRGYLHSISYPALPTEFNCRGLWSSLCKWGMLNSGTVCVRCWLDWEYLCYR